MKQHQRLFLSLVAIAFSFVLRVHAGVPDSIPQHVRAWDEYLEEQRYLGLLSDEELAELQQLYDELRHSPWDINEVTPEELRRIPFLRDFQVTCFIDYRRCYGPFRSVSDLKLVRGWDAKLLTLLLPVLVCREGREQEKRTESRGQLEFVGRVSLRKQTETKQEGLGGNEAALLRLLYERKRHLSLYFSAEKDYLEPWNYGRHRGFDSYNAHLAIRERGLLHSLVLGDYRVTRGCGLVLGQGIYPMSFLSLAPRLPEGIRPIRSSTETNYCRGIALELGRRSFRLGAFASARSLDGKVDEDKVITSLSETGLHRTSSEWSRRATVPMRLFGGWVEYREDLWRIALQGVHQDWHRYVLHSASGASHRPRLHDLSSSSALSLSYAVQSRQGQAKLMGELGRSNLGAWATIHHLLLQQLRVGDLRLSYWYVGSDYWSYYGHGGTHALRPNDEAGGRFMWLVALPLSATSLELYADRYRRLSEAKADTMKHRGWSYGANLNVELNQRKTASLLASFRERRKAGESKVQRFSLSLHQAQKEWESTCTFRWSRAGGKASWAVLGVVHTELRPHIRISLFGDYFEAPNWQSRLYASHPRARYEYTSMLLFGEGYDLGLRLTWKPNYHILLEGKVVHQHQRYDTRPSMTQATFTLLYRP